MCARPKTETKALANRNGAALSVSYAVARLKTPQRPRTRLIGFETQTPLDEQSRDHSIGLFARAFENAPRNRARGLPLSIFRVMFHTIIAWSNNSTRQLLTRCRQSPRLRIDGPTFY